MCSGTTVLQHANELLVEQHRICLAPDLRSRHDFAQSGPCSPVTPSSENRFMARMAAMPQAGISRSSSTPNVLVYSDHDKAAANGYDFDGWDQSQHVYYYTGEGKVGDQFMLRGNRAIAEHQADGTALRLFVAVGNRPGSGTRIHQYVGQFAVDTDLPYVVRRAPGTDGVPRDVFVFRLLPVGPVAAGESPHISTIEGAVQAAAVAPVAVDAVPVAAINIEQSEVEKTVSGPVVQKEAQLTRRFQKYLEAHHRK